MEHQSEEDGKKWSQNLDTPLPWQSDDVSGGDELAKFKQIM